MRTASALFLLLLVSLPPADFARAVQAQVSQEWLSYEPAVVQLEGVLTLVQKYGPSNYGENPETDEKVQVLILVLKNPADVRADPDSDLNTDSFEGVKEVQLVIFPKRKIAYKHLIGKNILARGTLYQRHTGHHYTDVVLTVISVHLPKDNKDR